MRAFGTMAACLGKLLLSPEEIGSPRGAGSFSPKQFGGPREPEASLGEPRPKKLPEVTLLPLPLGIFRILDQNVERSHTLSKNWRRTIPYG